MDIKELIKGNKRLIGVVLLIVLLVGMSNWMSKMKETFAEIERLKKEYDLGDEVFAREEFIFGKMLNVAKDAVSETKKAAQAVAKGDIDTLKSQAKAAVKTAGSAAKTVGGAVASGAKTAGGAIASGAKTAGGAVAGAAKKVAGEVGGVAGKVIGAVKGAAEKAFDTVTKPVKEAIKWIKRQLYELIPFFFFQIGFIALVMFWVMIPDDVSTGKQIFIYVLMFVMLIMTMYITMIFWEVLGDGNEGLGAYIWRKEKQFFGAVWSTMKFLFSMLLKPFTGGSSKEDFLTCGGLCGVM